MKFTKSTWAAVGASLLLAACGGGGDGNQAPKVKFSSMVSFGDSLSDVGSYAVGDALTAGGGKFTVNGITTDTIANPASKNWTERIAAQLGLPAPCAAETGLAGTGWLTPTTAAPITFHSGCYNYAQGGSRVTALVGPVNIANGDDVSLKIGALTVPVVTQIQNHLTAVTKFSGTELVTVMAGANDVLQLTDDLKKAAEAAGGQAFVASLTRQLAADTTTALPGSTAAADISGAFISKKTATGDTAQAVLAAFQAAAVDHSAKATAALTAAFTTGDKTAINAVVGIATTAAEITGANYAANPTNYGPLVVAMDTAGVELANMVKTDIVGKGAKYVAVLNLPDVSLSPSSKAASPASQALIHTMVTTFNAKLKAGLANTPNVILVDIYANIVDQVANPSAYGLTSVTLPACDKTKVIPLSSMLCTKDTLMAGDVSHYLFAEEGGHPTPFELKLIASVVARDLAVAGWL
jgi:phospholipase/lecithinase/hemolysin